MVAVVRPIYEHVQRSAASARLKRSRAIENTASQPPKTLAQSCFLILFSVVARLLAGVILSSSHRRRSAHGPWISPIPHTCLSPFSESTFNRWKIGFRDTSGKSRSDFFRVYALPAREHARPNRLSIDQTYRSRRYGTLPLNLIWISPTTREIEALGC